MIANRWLAGALVAAGFGVACTGARDTTSLAARTAVQLTVEQRNAVLVEMRTLLASVHGVLGAVARSDSAGIRAAANASGTAAAADPALEKLLPAQWLQLATRTHQGFDSLAAVAGAGRDTVVARLGALTTNCVSCHAIYRVAP